MFEHVGEETLREILCVVYGVPATAYETVKWRPIDLAKLRKGRTGYLRFGLASPCREDHAPVGRRKDIAATLPICRLSIQINGLFQDWRR